MSLTGRVCPVRVVCRVKVSRCPDCSVPVEDVEITAPPTAAALGDGVILPITQKGWVRGAHVFVKKHTRWGEGGGGGKEGETQIASAMHFSVGLCRSPP